MKLRLTGHNDARPCQNLLQRWSRDNSAAKVWGKAEAWTSRYGSVRSCVDGVKPQE